jgi:hypothetical protein
MYAYLAPCRISSSLRLEGFNLHQNQVIFLFTNRLSCQACVGQRSTLQNNSNNRILRIIKILRMLKIIRLLKSVKVVECVPEPDFESY